MTDKKSFVDVEFRTNTAGLEKGKKGMKDLQKEQKETQKSTKKTADEFDSAGNRIASSTGKVDKRFKKTAKEAKKTNKEIKSLGGGFKSLIAQMSPLKKAGVAGLIAGVGLAVGKAVSTFANFEQALADLSAITGATGQDLEFYSDKARELGAVTTLSASQVADAFRLVASAKPDLLESKEALALVTAEAITLAEAAGITVPEAANTMASALNQFGEEADQAARFTNVLAAGSKFGAASIAEMGEALRFGGVVAGNFGLSFEQTNAALQLFSTNAIKGGEAGTQLRGVLLALETKMDSEFRPSVVGLEEALRKLGEANLSAEEKVKLFGNRNIVAGEILSANVDKLSKLTEQVTGTSIASEQAATRTDTLQGAQKRLGSAFEELQLILAGDSGVGGALASFINFVADATLKVTGFFQALSNLGASETANERLDELNEKFGELSNTDLLNALNETEIALLQNAEKLDNLSESSVRTRRGLRDSSTALRTLQDESETLTQRLSDLSEAFSLRQLKESFKGLSTEELSKEITRVSTALEENEKRTNAITKSRAKNRKGIRDSKKELQELKNENYSLNRALLVLKGAMSEVVVEQKKLSDEEEEANKKTEAAIKLAKTKKEKIDDVKKALQEEIDELGRTNEEQELYNALKKAGIDENDEAAEGIKTLVEQLQKEREELEKLKKAKEAAAKAADDLAKANEKAAKEAREAWEDSRDTLSDFFFEFAKDGLSAMDTVVEGFKSMITKMLAEAAASGVMNLFGIGNQSQGFGGFFGESSKNGGNILSAVGGYAKNIWSDYSSGNLTAGSFVPSGISNLGNSISNAYLGYQGFSQTGASGLQGAYQGLTGTGEFAQGFVGPTRAELVGAQAVDWTQIGVNLLAGIAGAYAGREVFDNEGSTGIGSTVVGAIGAYFFGPWGAALGSFIGEGIEKVLGDIFGFGGKPSHNRVYQDLNFQNEEQAAAYYTDKGHHSPQIKAAEQMTEVLQNFSNIIGGSDFQGQFSVSARDGFEFTDDNGKRQSGTKPDKLLSFFLPRIIQYGDELSNSQKQLFLTYRGGAEDLYNYVVAVTGSIGPTAELSHHTLELARAFEGSVEELSEFVVTLAVMDKAIAETASLTPQLENVIRSFKGTNEEMLAFTGFVVQLSDMISNNPLDTAIQAFDEAVQLASDGIIGAYNRQVDSTIDIIASYDGSVESAGMLTQSLGATQQAALELAVGIMGLKQSLNDMFQSSAKSIREQLMSEQELMKARLDERDALFAAIDSMVNPDEIRAAAIEMDKLNNQLFSGLTDEEKVAYGEEFAEFAEMAAEKTTAQLDKTLEMVRDSQQALMDQVRDTLESAANRQTEAAETMNAAARTMLQAAARIPSSITVNVENSDVTG